MLGNTGRFGIETASKEALAIRMRSFVEELQATICSRIEELDGRATFRLDTWMRPGGGGGITSILEEGDVFEKAGVNTSAVHGKLPERIAKGLSVEGHPFFATGLSLVMHARNPYVPTVHANFRYFTLGAKLDDPVDQWFGGGADLTPSYPFLDDTRHFHRVWKRVCDAHPVADYDQWKRECDEYFHLPHRDEARGVGGIFFDYVRGDAEAIFQFVRAAGDVFLESYVPIVERRRHTEYGTRERDFQEVRRGRYAEFNLLFDRGTKFGIETLGRTESILISLPPHVQWRYDWCPEPGSREDGAMWHFKPRDWLSLADRDVP